MVMGAVVSNYSGLNLAFLNQQANLELQIFGNLKVFSGIPKFLSGLMNPEPFPYCLLRI